jgi:hypothetical protein
VSSLQDSICVKPFPALPCRATDCPVPSGLIAPGDLRFFSTPFKAQIFVGSLRPDLKSCPDTKHRSGDENSVPQGRLDTPPRNPEQPSAVPPGLNSSVLVLLSVGRARGLPEFYAVALGIVEPGETAVVVILALGVNVDSRCMEFCQHSVQIVHP